MGPSRIPGSFRDPSGFLFRSDGQVYRQVNSVFAEQYELMMSSGFYETAVGHGLLVPHQEIEHSHATESAHKVLKPVQIPFISHPYEWSFSQLKDAALLTLKLQNLALEHGLWLKDASAYNVQFLDGRPVFIDTLSFEAYPEGTPWIAYQQFCKHFLAPLALMAHCHVGLSKLLRLYIDGVPLDMASAMLPARTRINPALYIHIHLHARMQQRYGGKTEIATRAKKRKLSRTGMVGIISALESAVRKLRWQPEGTEWASYYDATNYSDDARGGKFELVGQLIDQVEPTTVWDMGANTGMFSRLASERGIHTVAFDIDPAAVEKNYQEVREKGEERILPLVMDLTNPSPDIGWNCDERASLTARGPIDLAMALALVHHLAISNNLPLDYIASFFRSIAKYLIIEFVPKTDSQVQRLLATRKDIFPDYTQEGFEQAFAEYFELRRTLPVKDSERTLYLMEQRAGVSPRT